jgi:PTS system galactitol-specific IIC component
MELFKNKILIIVLIVVILLACIIPTVWFVLASQGQSGIKMLGESTNIGGQPTAFQPFKQTIAPTSDVPPITTALVQNKGLLPSEGKVNADILNTVINATMNFLTYISGLGNVLMMPLVLTLLSLAFGMKFVDAIRNSVKVGIGFIGFSLVSSMVVSIIGPAVNLMVEKHDMGLTVLDLGWPAISTIAYGTLIGALILVIGLLFNIILISLKIVRTLDVDMWNYWQWALTGSFVALLTGSLGWGIAAALIQELITLLLADASAKMIQDYLKIPDISIAHSFAVVIWVLAWPLAKLWDFIGWRGNESIEDLGKLKQKLGILMDPIIVGLAIGILIGSLGYLGGGLSAGEAFKNILMVGMASAGMLVLLPKVVGILLEGIKPISEQARLVLQKKFASDGRSILIGMDSAVMANDEMILIISVLLIPILIFLAPILPGNSLIPFAGITGMVYTVCMIAPLVRGDFLKMLVTSAIIMSITMILGTNWAPEVTAMIAQKGFAMPEGAATVSFLANPLAWAMVAITRLF